METHYQIEITKREAELYRTLVDKVLRGDLSGAQTVARSGVGRDLYRALGNVAERRSTP